MKWKLTFSIGINVHDKEKISHTLSSNNNSYFSYQIKRGVNILNLCTLFLKHSGNQGPTDKL